MSHNETKNELPPHYEQLKTAVNRTSNWRERLAAVEELGQWKHKKTIDLLMHRMNSDAVYKIREAAFEKLRQLGEAVELPAKPIGDLVDGLMKTLVRIKKSLPKDHAFEAFKDKLQKMRLDIYDTYEGDKGQEFEAWLEKTWASVLTRRTETGTKKA